MAKLLSNTYLFSTCSYGHHQDQRKGVTFIPKNSAVFYPTRLKLKYQTLRSRFHGKPLVFQENRGMPNRWNCQFSIKSQTSFTIGKARNWWEKGLQPNMKEVTSAQDLVDSLLNAGDKLVVVDFFSPGCGGCKALHPKICQLAEKNPEVQYLHVNYEEHKRLCYSLHVHVLPFFRFYRGAYGRLCSFSCTNATIKKFKGALAKHNLEQCSLGETKGLEEKELHALAANRDLPFNYTPKQTQPVPAPAREEIVAAEAALSHTNFKLPLPFPSTISKPAQQSEEKTLLTAGR